MPVFDTTLTSLTAAHTFNGDSAIDLFGTSVSAAGDVNGDGFDDVIVGAVGDDNNGVYSGSARVLSGSDGSVLYTFNGESAYDRFSHSDSAGDVNGDGFDDVIVGAYGDNNNGINSGSARVLSGTDGSVLYTFNGDSDSDWFGRSVSAAGDVNNDGFDDVIVGAHLDDNNGTDSGSARVFSGADGSMLYTFNGDSGGDNFGYSVSAGGDVNGDGFDDVIVGAWADDNNGTTSGSARIFSGTDGSVLFTFNGDNADDRFGFSVSAAGDVNGDGFADVIVGAHRDDNNGNNSGSARILSGVDGSVLYTFNGDSANDWFGWSVSTAGDVNNDGFADVIVGANQDDNNGTTSGSARLFTSTGTGALDTARVFVEGASPVVLDDDVAVADAALDALNGGNGDYHGASLNIVRQGGADGDDVFAFAAMTNVTVNGGNLEAGGNTIATFTTTGGTLSVSFTNANGSTPITALVNEILQAVTYQNTNTALGLGQRTTLPLDWTFSDGTSNLTDSITIVHSGIGGLVLTGTPGDDTLTGSLGNDTINGLGGNDNLIGGGGNDWLNGGSGVDTADYSGETASVFVRLNNGTAVGTSSGSDTLSSIENVEGSNFGDVIFGDNFDNILNGEGGNDDLQGGSGNDTLNGDAGDDTVFGAQGNDVLNGGTGNDVLNGASDNDTVSGGSGIDLVFGEWDDDTLFGNDGNDTLSGGPGADTVSGGNNDDLALGAAGDDTVFGGAGMDTVSGGWGVDAVYGGGDNDTVFGAGGNDTVSGGAGNDIVSGGTENDTVSGNAGNDNLMGAPGIDRLDGGTGNDILTGGTGADTLVFALGYDGDQVQGFEDDIDTLELDDALWGGGLTATQVVTTFATQTSPGIVDFNFGGGDTLRVIQGAGISTTDLFDDILIV